MSLSETQLGIDVEPAQVRLMPRTGERYMWKRLAAKNESPQENQTSLAQKLSAKKERLFAKPSVLRDYQDHIVSIVPEEIA